MTQVNGKRDYKHAYKLQGKSTAGNTRLRNKSANQSDNGK